MATSTQPNSEGHRDRASGHRGLRRQGGRRRQPPDFMSEAGHRPDEMGSCSEDSRARTLQTCRQGLRGAHS
eukprot:983227-Alexandrium_andersonii.AAC.1